MSRTDRKAARSADWLSKTLAGLIFGLAIAFVCMGFYAWYGPGDIHSANKSQFVMWLVSPLWLVILAAVYLFPSGKQAWTVLFVVTALLYCSFFLLRSL
jgi:cytochrome bd-type quinol oxidase subunit 2